MKRFGVKREDLARALAERSRLTQGEAQDELDRLVHGIVRSLRQGRAAEMPGIGTLTAKLPFVAAAAAGNPKPGSTKPRKSKA